MNCRRNWSTTARTYARASVSLRPWPARKSSFALAGPELRHGQGGAASVPLGALDPAGAAASLGIAMKPLPGKREREK